MFTYQTKGFQLGYLMISEQQAFEIWASSGAGVPQRLEAAAELDSSPIFSGLRIDHEEIWLV